MSETRKDMLWRAYAVYFLMMVAGLAVLGRAFYIHFAEGDRWKGELEANTVRLKTIDATRGNICARDGRLLATSVSRFDIRMDVASPNISDELFNDQVDELSTGLARLFNDRGAREYRQNLRRERKAGNRYYLIKRDISYDQLKALKQLPIFREGRHGGGLIVEKRDRRAMPFQDLARRTIGYEGGGRLVGLEGAYSAYLQGKDGQRLERRISSGAYIPIDDDNLVDPQNGNDIITNIDINIQDVAENALRRQLAKKGSLHGCVVLMEVATGKIRAIANLTLDTATGEYLERYNYAIGLSYEPGSTFKLASMIASLEAGRIRLSDTVNTTGGRYQVGRAVIEDSHRGGYGRISLQTAFEVSSNVGIAKTMDRVWKEEPEKFIEALHDMGLGVPLGVEIYGEGKPVLYGPDSASWSRTSLPFISMGYETRLTPLQLLSLYNAVANDGRMMKPQFVSEIVEAGRVVRVFEPEVLVESIASEKTLEQARGLLEGVVLRGTATALMDAPMRIAGKTGTAQVYHNGTYKGNGYYASFVGYFPADEPKYSCIVLARAPYGKPYYGSDVAAPVFLEVARKVYSSEIGVKDVEADSLRAASTQVTRIALAGPAGRVVSTLSGGEPPSVASETVRMKGISPVPDIDEVHYTADQVPDVRGLGLRSAMAVLEGRGFVVDARGVGRVSRQSIPPGARYRQGMHITIYLD